MEDVTATIGTATINVETKPKSLWIEVGDTVLNTKRVRSGDWPFQELPAGTELKVLRVDHRGNHRHIPTIDAISEEQDYVWKFWADEVEKVIDEEDSSDTADQPILEEIRDLLKELVAETKKKSHGHNSFVSVIGAPEDPSETAKKALNNIYFGLRS